MILLVADTGPLHYLVEIGAVQVLSALVGKVIVPVPVWRELQDPKASATVGLMDSVRRLWRVSLGTYDSGCRLSPGSSTSFIINFTLPPGLFGSAIRYGEVPAQGWPGTRGYQPYPSPERTGRRVKTAGEAFRG
ncbi:MAG: hypothetical protein NTW21_09335 [Verrucomicrobia bacterium]|nr:hypothetical protein [Verrucomicrobiota bacterium]